MNSAGSEIQILRKLISLVLPKITNVDVTETTPKQLQTWEVDWPMGRWGLT